VQQIGYLWAYIFTAIRPATGEDATLVLPSVDTAAMQIFLDHVGATRPADAHLVMVLDGAGWHASRDLVVPPSITLVVLPPCSPEIKPLALLARALPFAAPAPLNLRHHRSLLRRLDAPRRGNRPDQIALQLPVDREGRFIETRRYDTQPAAPRFGPGCRHRHRPDIRQGRMLPIVGRRPTRSTEVSPPEGRLAATTGRPPATVAHEAVSAAAITQSDIVAPRTTDAITREERSLSPDVWAGR
jgi:hypothetical protein